MNKIIKQMCWMIGGLIVFCTMIFHHAILTVLATWSLQIYSMVNWGEPLQYEEVILKGHQLVIVRPQFGYASFFTAEQIAVNFHVKFWERQLLLDIGIKQPHWHFDTTIASEWEKWAKLLSQEEKWIKIHPHFHIEEGRMSWNFDDAEHQLKFDLDIHHQEGGLVKIHFDSPEHHHQSLMLQTVRVPHGVEVSCYCEQLDCPSLIALAQFLGADFLPRMVTSGILQGELKAIFPGMGRPYLEGELLIDHFTFQQKGSPLKGEIEEAKLQLKRNEIAYESAHPLLTTVGRFDILKPAVLSYHSPMHTWHIHQIVGSIELDNVETALLDLHAQGGNDLYPAQWHLQGHANLNVQRFLELDVNLSCSAQGRADGHIHLALNQLQGGTRGIKVQCEKLSYAECGFLQTLLATQWPIFNDILLEEGELNALIETHLLSHGMGELSIKQFEAFRLKSKLKPWNMACNFQHVRGYGKVLLGQADFWQSVQAELHIEDGKVQFEDLSPPLPMTDIQAHFLIQQGHVEHSLVTLQVAGLKGKMDVEWGDHKQLLIFKLDGMVQDLSDLFPIALQEGIRKQFTQNRLMVLANLKRQNEQIELGGTLHIQRTNHSEQMDLVHFGCELKKIDFGKESKCIPIGWFHAQKLPLEKFLSPFIFRNDILSMKGEAEFKGSFDDQYLSIKYDADDLKIENEDLCITLPHLHANVPGQLVGSHQLNLHTYAYQGTLPIQSASYLEKNTGLIFHDIQGMATFTNGLICINPIEACCEGIDFAGELELDYRDPAPGVFDLMLHCPSVSGKVSQIQHLLTHLDQPSLLYNIPLEGDVTGKESGLYLKFAFIPHDYHLQASAKGIISEGALSFEGANMALRGIYMDVDYDHQRQLLEFSDIQGTLLVGKPRCVEEYFLSGSHIHFDQIAQPDIALDIAIKDGEEELMRIVGHTDSEREGVKNVYLNPQLTHFSSIYPNQWKCQLKDGLQVEQLECKSTFDLGTLVHDLSRFRQTGLLFLSHSILDKIAHLYPFEGEGSLILSTQPDQSYTFHLEGNHIKQGNFPEHFASIKGSKQDKKWIIDQMQWDDWNAYAELHPMDKSWKIPFLGLKIGHTLLLGLNGEWLQDEACLKATLKFCQVDLSKLDDFSFLQSFVAKWWPKGILNAKGKIEWQMLSPHFGEGCQADLFAEVSNFSVRNCPLKISNEFQIKIKPQQEICLENAHIELNEQAYIDLKQLNYQLPQETLHALEAAFQISHQQLETVAKTLHHHFPDILDASVKEVMASAKQQDFLKGTLAIETPILNQSTLRLALEDGLYRFKNRDYDLKKFQLEIAGNDMHISAFSQEERLPFQIIGHVQWPSCEEGECKLISLDGSKPLVITWKNPAEGKWSIRSMQGEFGGCLFFLREDPNSSFNGEWSPLQGKISIDFNRVSTLLAPQIAETIQKLKIGSFYTFIGNFWINPERGQTLLETLSFKGKLKGEEVILKGYQMHNVQADVQYVPGRLDVQNLLIEDRAGSVQAANCVALLDVSHKNWSFFIPRLNIKNLRLTLLRDTESYGQTPSKFRFLVLKKMDFHDLRGILDQVSTWQAQGSLHFVNSSRKNPLHPLFAIPAEIILRLGLDPHVLNPVTGIIDFNLQGDRFYLKRFKDVFSEGRGSKFYLVGPEPSWMDFDGNLSVNVRMKQYNLIFKIVELFTVSIEGNIRKPRYILQKQAKGSKKGHSPILTF